MSVSENICPACGRVLKKRNRFLMPAVIGSIVGFFTGLGFVAYWFGVHGGFFHTMALIHEIAGTLLGILIGLVIGAMRGAG